MMTRKLRTNTRKHLAAKREEDAKAFQEVIREKRLRRRPKRLVSA